MREDFKKRFMDILFEPEDDEEVVAQGKMEEIQPKKAEKVLNAKDVLYHKADNSSAFIDLDNKNVFETSIGELNASMYSREEEEVDVTYEPQPTISPIFGVVRKASVVQTVETPKEVSEPLVKKPTHSHLGTILSPIYGYGEFEKEEEEEKEEISFDNTPVTPLPEIKEEVKEEIKEDNDDIKLVFNEEEKSFENHTLEDILEGFKDKTLVSDREINLFDDLFKEDK